MHSSFIRRYNPLWKNAEALNIDDTLFPETCLNYRAYGLLLSSAIRIDHFTEVERESGKDPDVYIRHGDIFGKDYTPPSTIQIESSPEKLLLRGARSATFLVTGGNTVTIEPLPNGNPAAIQQILLGWAFAGLFHQRAMLALHGSAICKGEDCFVVCAPSKGGKSTLTAAFLNKDFSFLDDNIAMAEFSNGKTYIAPGSPELRLWQDAMNGLSFEYTNAGPIRCGLDKFSLMVKDRFKNEKTRLRKIFLLKTGHGSEVSFVNVKGADKFRALLANVFCIGFLGESGFNPLLLKQIHKLTESVPVVNIMVPEKRPTPDGLRDIILGSHVI